MTFLINLGVERILYSFRLVQEGRAGKEIPKSSRFEFLEKISENYFLLQARTNCVLDADSVHLVAQNFRGVVKKGKTFCEKI